MVANMPDQSLLTNPKHWRDRAEKTRAVAGTAYNEEAKSRLLKIAIEYERLADYAETRVKEKSCKLRTGDAHTGLER